MSNEVRSVSSTGGEKGTKPERFDLIPVGPLTQVARHFGVGAAYLSRQQASQLAAVLPNPRAWSPRRPSPYVQRRANWIRQQMWQLGGSHYLKQLEQHTAWR